MYRWLHVLDMAISPAMFAAKRLTPEHGFGKWPRPCFATLCAAVNPAEINRDKTDLIFNFSLPPSPRSGSMATARLRTGTDRCPLSPFEIALIEILADTDVPFAPGKSMCNCCGTSIPCAREIGPLP